MTFPFKIIDLTYSLLPTVPSWDGGCGFKKEIVWDYADCTTAVKFCIQNLTMQAGIGTHLDAPAHCFEGSTTINALALEDLIAPCVVINIAEKSTENYSLSVEDITTFETQYGTIAPGSFVIVHTGWAQFWNNPERYRNNHRFPSVSLEAAHLLLSRNIVGIGIDTLGPDRPTDNYVVHEALLGTGKYIVENVAHAELLPPTGSYSLALPIKIAGGTEAPIRLIALIQK